MNLSHTPEVRHRFIATRVLAVFTVICCLSFIAVSAQAEAQESGASGGGGFPDSRVFAFGSMEDRGEYIYCFAHVTSDAAQPERLLPGNERCFKEKNGVEQFSIGSSVSGAQARSQTIIGMHFDGLHYTPPSLTILGENCDGGVLTLKGYWRDRIESTFNGCSIIEHYSDTTNRAFSGNSYISTGLGDNMGASLQNSVESISYSGTSTPSTRVVAFEVTQGIQDWRNSIKLVRGKEAVARVFIETVGSTSARSEVSGALYYTVAGETESQPISPMNYGGKIIVLNNVTARRNNPDSSLNFIIPATILSTTEGDTSVSFRFVPTGVSQLDCSLCSTSVTYTYVPETEIYFAPVTITTGTEPNIRTVNPPTENDLNEQYSRIQSLMPFPQSRYIPSTLSGSYHVKDTNDLSTINNALLTLLMRTTSRDPNSLILGIISGAPPRNTPRGKAKLNENSSPSNYFDNAAVTFDGNLKGNISYGYDRNTASHEIGHLFEQRHPARVASQVGDKPPPAGFCGAEGFAGDDPYPHQVASSSLEGGWLPAIGPTGSSQSEIWGFDTRLAQLNLGNRHFSYGIIKALLTSVDPAHNASFMSYCIVTSSLSQRLWMDAFHYDRIISEMENRATTTTTTTPPIPFPGIPPTTTTLPVVFISGTVQSHPITSTPGVRTFADVVFGPMFSSHSSTLRPPPISSRLHLEMYDDLGNTLVSIPVNLWGSENSGHLNIQEDSEEFFFAAEVSNPPEYKSFALVEYTENSDNIVSGAETSASSILAEVKKSDNAPTVSINTPKVGQTFGGDKVRLSWSGSDADGDTLTYRVFYSANGGVSYDVVELDTTETSLTLDRSILPGSDNAKFKVSVSDGASSTYSESPAFSVKANPPSVQIITPSSNAVFTGSQGFALNAMGYDREDSILPSSAFQWHSSIDGEIGRGSYISLSAAELTPGTHEITVKVIDTSGMVATAVQNIQIKLVSEIPEAISDTAAVDLNETKYINVLYNDIDSEGDVNFSLFEITEAPELGDAKIELSPEFIWTIKYSGNTRGKDSLKYQICDGIDRCSEATLTIDVGLSECTILGTENADTLSGTSGNDIICGLGGDDLIRGSGGNDIIWGGEGDDTIYGGPGDDTIYGEIGEDEISGNRGNDKLFGGENRDTIYGNTGNNLVYGGSGADSIYGGNGNDIIEGNEGNDEINGGHGSDTIKGDEGEDSIRGSNGNDQIWGGKGNDSLNGGNGDDTIFGEEGSDTITGGNGNDNLYGGTEADTLYGNDGDDTIEGNEGDDQIRGGDGRDTLNGGKGSDTIRSNSGADTIDNIEENDVILGEDDRSNSIDSR